MIEFLDAKLFANGLAQNAISEKNARVLFYLACEVCVGIEETGGDNKGPLVELMQKTIGDSVGESWCMSFIQTCLAYAEFKTGVQSPIEDSESCLQVWLKTPQEMRVKTKPLRGAIVIWRHGVTTKGHTGVVTEYTDSYFNAIEGNTTDQSEVNREGGGVFFTKRYNKSKGEMRVLGFLKPF